MTVILKVNVRLRAPIFVDCEYTRSIRGGTQFKVAVGDEFFRNSERILVNATIKDAKVSLELQLGPIDNPKSGVKGQWFGVGSVAATVRREEVSRADIEAVDSFEERKQFWLPAWEAVQRLVDFCRYELGQPLHSAPDLGDFDTFEWIDESGVVFSDVDFGVVLHEFPGLPGSPSSLRSRALQKTDLDRVQAALTKDAVPETHRKFLSAARDSVYGGDVAQSVLLLAVACEVAAKSTFLRQDSLAANTYDYLEEKRQVGIRVVELVDVVARRASGKSFKDSHHKQFTKIDHLFRVRNKIAHRGEPVFRDDDGNLHRVEPDHLTEFWLAANDLCVWLEGFSNS